MHLMTCIYVPAVYPPSFHKQANVWTLNLSSWISGNICVESSCLMRKNDVSLEPSVAGGQQISSTVRSRGLNPPTKQRIQHVTSGHWKSSKLIGNDIDYIEILNHQNSVGHSYNLCIQDYPRTSSADLRPRWSSVEWQEFGQQHLKPRCHDRATEHCHVGWPRGWFLWNGWKMLEINMEFWSLAMAL